MARPARHTLEANGLALRYAETTGGDEPLVLLHGLAARWQVFAPLLAGLALDWHCYALDLRGHGESGRAPGHYRIPDFAGDVVALLDQRVREPAVLYGHSLGGWLALYVAVRRPEMVRGLVVADSAIYPDTIDPDAAVSYLADLPLALRSMAKSLQQLDPEVMAAFRRGELTQGFDADEILPRITCPVLLLQANPELGGLLTDASVKRALGLLRRAHHVRFDELGHGLHVQHAEPVLDAVREFLGGLADQPTTE